MKTYTLLFGSGIAILNALVLVPQLRDHALLLVAGSLALALWLVIRTLTAPSESADIDYEMPEQKTRPAETAPVRREDSERPAQHAAVSLLGLLQEKGRLVDFLMEDVTRATDAQLGAAARVVHQGGSAVLREYFSIEPVCSEAEGSQVTVPAESRRSDFQLTGKVEGEGPFHGRLVHKGWRSTEVRLPRPVDPESPDLLAIAPAQVEVLSGPA